jgi:hypothetical protein
MFFIGAGTWLAERTAAGTDRVLDGHDESHWEG